MNECPNQDLESLARIDLPYRAEYCKTSRGCCKKCNRGMKEDDLKLANMTRSRFHDGFDAIYYHVKCFFEVRRPNSIAEIRNFETLRYEDQKMLLEAVKTNGQSLLVKDNESQYDTPGKRQLEGFSEQFNALSDFIVEYAKSGRSSCNLCSDKITKHELRLGKMDYETETPFIGGPITRWFHVDCFKKAAEQLEFDGQINKLPGFEDLDKKDQTSLKSRLKKLSGNIKTKAKKIKRDPDECFKENNNTKMDLDDLEEERLLKEQSDKFFELRYNVNQVKKSHLELLLCSNLQKSNFKNPSQLVDAATDLLMFGAIDKCPNCNNNASMIIRGGGYICSSSVNEWEPCTYESRQPNRLNVIIPEEILNRYPYFLEEYKFSGGNRLFSSAYYRARQAKEQELNNITAIEAPLSGLTIGIISWKLIQMDKRKVQKKISSLGAEIQTSLDKSLFVIVTNKAQLGDESQVKVQVAKELDIPLVDIEFLFNISSKTDVIPKLNEFLLNKWEGDLEARFINMNINQLKNNIKSRSAASSAKRIYKSGSVAKSQSLIVRDGSAVDPDSGYAEYGVVYRKGSIVYSVVLNSVDVSKNKNSFYKIQIIETDSTKKDYILFRSWGRIGSNVGGNTCTRYKKPEHAIYHFEELFQEKTDSPFITMVDGTFKRKHGLYYPVELDYGQLSQVEDPHELDYNPKSKLAKSVQELICFIFDINQMNMVMKEYKLDAEKMPLGKLSKKQISSAMETLRDLEKALETKSKGRSSKTTLIALTNKFYSLIPQSFGDGQVELITSLEQINAKNLMLAGLSQVEVAHKMCTSIDRNSDQLPVDQHYMNLGCTITSISAGQENYDLILDYVKTNHAITHNNYTLDVEQIFKIDRNEDIERFKKHKSKSRILLWHGSRTTNFAGILQKGLRIAPEEAPVTGYMFGKGIYFADICSKAANYCMTDPSFNTGLLLLCEVALGKMQLVYQSDEKLPENLKKGYHSIKGVGKSCTNPETHRIIEDNLLIPIGSQKSVRGSKSQLLYNEFVVYDESQVNIRYIVKVKFNFKSLGCS